jgi:hypothetical protein
MRVGAAGRPGVVRSSTDRCLLKLEIEFTLRCSVRLRAHETMYTAQTTARMKSTTNVTLRACLCCS